MGASKAFSTALLFFVNCVLLAAGALVLYGSIHAKNSDWFDVADSYWDGADSVLTGFEVVGGVILGIAVLGTIATLCRWRFGLLLYAFVIFLVLILFVAVAVFGFIVRNRANDWKGKSYPADSDEKSLKPEFDRVYCYAQGAYICNEMNVTEAASIFFPSVANSTLLASFSSLKGVNAMCDALLSSIPSLSSVCSGCKQAKDAENFTSVLDWANDKCPRTSQTLLWCGTYLGSGDDSSITTGTAPYTQCRPEFLSYVSRTARTVAAASVSIACGALLVIIFSCILRRREREDEYNNVAFAGGNTMGTPQYPNNAYSTPQTSQPLYGNQPNNLYSKV